MDQERIIAAINRFVTEIMTNGLTLSEGKVVFCSAAQMIDLVRATPHATAETLNLECFKLVMKEIQKEKNR